MYNLLLRESFEVRPVHGGQRALSLQHRRPKDSTSGRVDSARAVYIILTYDFSRKFCFLHTFIATSLFCIVPSVVVRARARALNATPRVLSSEESVCVCVRETRKSASAIESAARKRKGIFEIHWCAADTFPTFFLFFFLFAFVLHTESKQRFSHDRNRRAEYFTVIVRRGSQAFNFCVCVMKPCRVREFLAGQRRIKFTTAVFQRDDGIYRVEGICHVYT